MKNGGHSSIGTCLPAGREHRSVEIKNMNCYFVYVLKSLKDQRYYIGQTSNIERRLSDHNSGRVKSTKGRRPLILIYSEKCKNRMAALLREKEMKSGQWRELLKEILIQNS